MFDTISTYRNDIRASIPPGLDDMKPGLLMATELSVIDISEVSGYDRVVVLRAHQRMASYYQAAIYRDMASIHDVMIDDHGYSHHEAFDGAESEIRAALSLTRRATETELVFALELHQRLPRLAAKLSSGQIDVRKAKIMELYTMHLTGASANAVVDEIYDEASTLTTGQLTARLRKLCIDTTPEESNELYNDAVANRRIWVSPTEAGTANFFGYDLPPDRVTAISNRIHEIAKSMRGDNEVRSMDQLRADVMLDILEGTTNVHGDGAVVDIRVDLDTLADLSENSGDLAGYGPVIADIARQVAEVQHKAEWRVVVTDPDSGEPVHVGITKRRPSVSQRRLLEARDTTCIFPGCRMPAASSDIDHRIPFAEGGHTETCCLAPLCRHDHCIRHANGWSYERLEEGGYRWTSKLGHTYITNSADRSRAP
jgi:hypothetical protein